VQLLAALYCTHSLLPGSVANDGWVTARKPSMNADSPMMRNVMVMLSLVVVLTFSL
jgi:hypothetical protein